MNNNNKFYVRDGQLVKYFNTVPEVVSFLEEVVKLKYNMNRQEWMQHVADLGYGFGVDNEKGQVFVESLSQNLEVGVVKEGKNIRTNIYEATNFSNPGYGD
jgi:hypothetical protein